MKTLLEQHVLMNHAQNAQKDIKEVNGVSFDLMSTLSNVFCIKCS